MAESGISRDIELLGFPLSLAPLKRLAMYAVMSYIARSEKFLSAALGGGLMTLVLFVRGENSTKIVYIRCIF